MTDALAYRIRGLLHSYDGGAPVLDVPALDIPFGEIGAIVGPNGSGKTTLLSIMALLLRPSHGSVIFDGAECAQGGPLRQARRRVTLVHQKPVLFSTTVEKNIAFGMAARGTPRARIAPEVRRVAEGLGVGHLLKQDARRLSGGEAQRVVLARALILATPVLLLDEPTSFLDESMLDELARQVLRRSAEGQKVTWLATHDVPFAQRVAHRIVQIREGRFVSEDVPTSGSGECSRC